MALEITDSNYKEVLQKASRLLLILGSLVWPLQNGGSYY